MRKFILLLLLPVIVFAYELSKDPLKITDSTDFPTAINNNALVELESTTKGLMWPRMTTDQKDAISDGLGGDTVLEEAMAGLFVYDIDRNKPYVWDGSRWKVAGGGGAGGGFQYLSISEINADDVKDEPGTFLTGKDAAFPNSVTGTVSALPEIYKDPGKPATETYNFVENLQVFRWFAGAGLDETDDFILGPEGTYPEAYLESTHNARFRMWYWTNMQPGDVNFYVWCSGATQPLPLDSLANIDTDVDNDDLRDREGAIFSADWSAIPSDCVNFRLGFKVTGNVADGSYILWDQYRLGILLDPFEEDITKGPETNHWDFVFKYYNGNGDDSTVTQLESGNNLTFGGAGTLDGTFDFDDTGKIGPMRGRSFRFTSGTGTTINNWIRLRDSFYLPNFTGNILNEIDLRINFWYWRSQVLTTSSIEPRLECFDVAGVSTGAYAATSPIGALAPTDTDLDGLLDTNEGNFVDTYFTVPSDGTCYQAKFGFQQTAEEDGVTFLFDRVRPGLLKAPDSINVQNNDFEIMFYYPKGRSNTPSILSSGNDAVFFNGGTLDGTFARDYTAVNQILPNDTGSNSVFKYTSGTGTTLNNWVALEPAEIPQGYRDEDNANGRDVLVSYWYWTNATSNTLEPRLYCTGNGIVINPNNTGNSGIKNTDYNNDNLKDADEGNRLQVSFFVPKACESVRFGFQQTVEEDSKTLLFEDVRIGILPKHYVDTGKVVLPTWNQTGAIGEIVAFAHDEIPEEFMFADGRHVLVANYPNLYAKIGCIYGCFPDNTSPTHFSIPDLRGNFMRGSVGSFQQIIDPADIDAITDTIFLNLDATNGDDGIVTRAGQAVTIVSNATIPGGIGAGSTYYVGNYDPTVGSFQLYTSRANALIGNGTTGILNITSQGTGLHTLSYSPNPDTGLQQGGDSSLALATRDTGSWQDYALATHIHTGGGAESANGPVSPGGNFATNGGIPTSAPIGALLSTESRPKNLLVAYAIRHTLTDYTQMVAYPVVQYEFENTYAANVDAAGVILSEGAEFLATCDATISCTFSETFAVAPICTANGAPATTTTTTVSFPAATTNLVCNRQGTDYREIGNQVAILNAGGVADADAIHDNVAGEIDAIAEKTVPVGTDLLIIEDSADSNNKKKVQIANLPQDSMCRGIIDGTFVLLTSKCTGAFTSVAAGTMTGGAQQLTVTRTDGGTNALTCIATPNGAPGINRFVQSTFIGATTCDFEFRDETTTAQQTAYHFTIYSND